jgi:hypothetical protein
MSRTTSQRGRNEAEWFRFHNFSAKVENSRDLAGAVLLLRVVMIAGTM